AERRRIAIGDARLRVSRACAGQVRGRKPEMRRLPSLSRAVLVFVGLVLAAATSGCAGLQLEQNVHQVRAIAKEARDNGAYKCAPRELALAETHLEFASRELDQGDYFRAKDHLEIADENARLAHKMSPRDRCTAPPKPGDRDGDGIPDN